MDDARRCGGRLRHLSEHGVPRRLDAERHGLPELLHSGRARPRANAPSAILRLDMVRAANELLRRRAATRRLDSSNTANYAADGRARRTSASGGKACLACVQSRIAGDRLLPAGANNRNVFLAHCGARVLWLQLSCGEFHLRPVLCFSPVPDYADLLLAA